MGRSVVILNFRNVSNKTTFFKFGMRMRKRCLRCCYPTFILLDINSDV